MTDKEKLEQLNGLAYAMYEAALNMTTDASRLTIAMYDYHQFNIQVLHKKEPAGEDLEDFAKDYANHFGSNEKIALGAVITGALWQKQQLIDKACEWLQGFMECSNLFEYEVSKSEQKEVINDFKQIMEE